MVFAASLLLTYISEKNAKAVLTSGQRCVAYKDWTYVLPVTILVLFAGVKDSYNDILMMNFEGVTTSFMEQANDLGKTLADYEILDKRSFRFAAGIAAV